MTLEDAGVSRQRVSDWMDIRDAGDGTVDGVISKALSEGRAPGFVHANHHSRRWSASGRTGILIAI